MYWLNRQVPEGGMNWRENVDEMIQVVPLAPSAVWMAVVEDEQRNLPRVGSLTGGH